MLIKQFFILINFFLQTSIITNYYLLNNHQNQMSQSQPNNSQLPLNEQARQGAQQIHIGHSLMNDAEPEQQKTNEEVFHDYDNIMEENIEFAGNEGYNGEQNPILNYANRIRALQQKEQILKYSVSEHEETVKHLFMTLYNKKRKLLQLITDQCNKKNFNVDIGLMEQFQEMRRTIENQYTKIQKLKTQIEIQGITVMKNDRDTIKLKEKKEELETEIERGRHFAGSQYVRDYLQRTYIHKVSYEDVKYEYEMKIKLKQCLQAQKQAYNKKREELKKAFEKEIQLKKQLQDEKAKLQTLVLQKQNKEFNGK